MCCNDQSNAIKVLSSANNFLSGDTFCSSVLSQGIALCSAVYVKELL